MGSYRDLSGQTFGRLTAVVRLPTAIGPGGGRATIWECHCVCGKTTKVRAGSLVFGTTRSCGCSRWHADAPSYKSAHDRVRRARGPAKKYLCACGEQARDWAYNHDDPNEIIYTIVYPSGRVGEIPYSIDPAHYTARCRACHRAADKKGRQA